MEKGLNILVTGTPGVGKTTFCEMLQQALKEKGYEYNYICVGKIVNEKKLYKTINKEFDVPEFDEDMVCDELSPIISKKSLILEFHSSSFFPEEWFDIVVLLRTNNTILYDRLKERNYNEKKITENIECEIMEVCSEEVKNSFKENVIMEMVSDKYDDMEKNVETVLKRITH